MLALLAGVSLTLAATWRSARQAVEAPLEPALGPGAATPAPAQPAPRPAAGARVELSGEPATSAREREWEIWRELHRPRPKGKGRSRGQRGAGGWRTALVLELGELARAGSPLAVELLARLVADPSSPWAVRGSLPQALEGVHDPLVTQAIRRGFELAGARWPEEQPSVIAYVRLAAANGGAEGARLLLEAYDRGDEALALAVVEALPGTSERGTRSAWIERLQAEPPARAQRLVRALIAWQDEQTEHALRALVHAVHLEPERRTELAVELAQGASAELALSLVTPFWTTRSDPDSAFPDSAFPDNTVHLAAAQACLKNPAIPRERLREVVEPIAAELLRSQDESARRVALEMLATPQLASPLVLDLIVQARPELAQAGLRREARSAVQTVSNHVRRRRRAR